MHRVTSRAAAKLAVFAVWLLAIGFLAAFAEGYIPTSVRQVLLALFVVGPLLVFGEAIIELMLHVVAYGVGRASLPVFTLGGLRSETSGDQLPFPWHGVARGPNGRYVVSHDATAVFGLVVLALAAVAASYAVYS